MRRNSASQKDLERLLKALANGRRLTLLKLLHVTKEMSVGEAARKIKLSFKSTSKHLTILASVSLLEKEQRSVTVYYRLAPDIPSFVEHILGN
jgi:DNA-binding transcriptional ArsR family regulator